jgi:hypothetical protein
MLLDQSALLAFDHDARDGLRAGVAHEHAAAVTEGLLGLRVPSPRIVRISISSSFSRTLRLTSACGTCG